MDSTIKNQRNSTIDTAKGLLMVSVVAGHIAGWPHSSVYLFYYFHLQAFFFISGYLFNYEKYRANPLSLIKSRANLYIKYLLYIFCFIALHNVITQSGWNGASSKAYTLHDYISSAIHSLIVPSEPLSGAMWFIPALLLMQGIIYSVIKLREALQASMELELLLVTAFFLIGFFLLHKKIYTTLDYRYLTFLPFFYAGVVARKVRLANINTHIVLLASLLVMIYARYVGVNLNDYYDINPFELIVVSLFGMIFCFSLSGSISASSLSNPLKWIGERTIHILALHFVGFKLATICLQWYGIVGEEKIYDLGGGIEDKPELVLIYLAAGVLFPVIAVMVYDYTRVLLLKLVGASAN